MNPKLSEFLRQPGVMTDLRLAVTEFVLAVNNRAHPLNVINHENRGDDRSFAANSVGPLTMWIPWCTTDRDFAQHHIDIHTTKREGAVVYSVWQHDGAVRYSTNGRWQDHGTPVPGASHEGGRRAMVIDAEGNFSVAETQTDAGAKSKQAAAGPKPKQADAGA